MPSGDFMHQSDISINDSHSSALLRAGLLPPSSTPQPSHCATPQAQALVNYIPAFSPFNGSRRQYDIRPSHACSW